MYHRHHLNKQNKINNDHMSMFDGQNVLYNIYDFHGLR